MRFPHLCLHDDEHGRCLTQTTGSYCVPHEQLRKKVRNLDRAIAKAVVEASPVCTRCGATEDLSAEHVLALANGGTNQGRRAVLCRPCNSEIGDRRRIITIVVAESYEQASDWCHEHELHPRSPDVVVITGGVDADLKLRALPRLDVEYVVEWIGTPLRPAHVVAALHARRLPTAAA